MPTRLILCEPLLAQPQYDLLELRQCDLLSLAADESKVSVPSGYRSAMLVARQLDGVSVLKEQIQLVPFLPAAPLQVMSVVKASVE